MPRPSLRLTPHGHLVLEDAADAPELDERIASRLADAFSRGSGHGLLRLGAGEVGQALPPVFLWWRGFATRYVGGVVPATIARKIAAPTEAELASLVLTAPMMAGAEYLTPDVLRTLWREIAAALADVARRGENRPAELPQGPEPRLEPGRPRALQPGREPQRRRCAVRLPRHLHDPALRPGARAARAAGPGAARIRRRGQPREAAVAAAAGAARGRDLRLAAADGRRGRDFTTRCAGRRARRRACSPACPTWNVPASSCACRRRGAPAARRGRR